MSLRFSTTPFFNTRQFYVGLEDGRVDVGFDIEIEYNHSPVKDQKLICGEIDATTMSMGKYVTSKLVSHTDVVPTDPLAVAAGLTYREGNGLFVRRDSDLYDSGDLAGCRVGIHDTTLAMTYHKAILEERFDVAPDTIEWVTDTHQRLGERMVNGDLDAVERINDWYWACRDDEENRMLYDMGQEWHAMQGYYPLVHLIAVDSALFDERRDHINEFLQALKRSRDHRDDNYEEILERFVASDGGEWNGEQTIETLRRVTGGVQCPFQLEEGQRRNVREWMHYADHYGVFTSVPIPDNQLFRDP
jgi:ABC-type nitrate/sulfonate/bicarbonate transport system substrate-binding protein